MSCKNTRDSYKLYKKSTLNPIDLKTYITYCHEYNKFLMSKVFEGHEVTLPMKLGTFCITGKKQKISFDENGKIKGLAPDWVKTKKLWDSNKSAKEKKQIVYHTNSHTDSTRYKIFWSKQKIIIQNKILYSFRLTRDNKRKINSLIKEGKQYVTKH